MHAYGRSPIGRDRGEVGDVRRDQDAVLLGCDRRLNRDPPLDGWEVELYWREPAHIAARPS